MLDASSQKQEVSKTSRFKNSKISRPSNLPLIGRSVFLAHLQQAALPFADSRFPFLSAFLNSNVFPWFWTYVKGMFHGKYPFSGYPDGDTGVFAMQATDGKVKLSILGDWGTGTEEAFEIAQLVKNTLSPDYTIHLGDVYYVGDEKEVEVNFRGNPVQGDPYIPVKFPLGSLGTFSIPGNHEMYGGGKPYFTQIIGDAGVCGLSSGKKQQASYFCLEADQWRIIGLDTGYNSVGLAPLGLIPGVNDIDFVGANCKLEDGLLNWLRTSVNPAQNRKATMIITHHQYYSVYERSFKKPAQQLEEFFAGQQLVWIWGHEHRLLIYDLYSENTKINCFGRCIGHGGMPVPLDDKAVSSPLLYLDPRNQKDVKPPWAQYKSTDGTLMGWNGFVNLLIDGRVMTLTYLDLKGTSLLVESFTAGANGDITQQLIADPVLQQVSQTANN